VQSYAQLPPEQSFLGQNELNSRQMLKNGCLAVFLGLVFIRSVIAKKQYQIFILILSLSLFLSLILNLFLNLFLNFLFLYKKKEAVC
jgi:hypothetical protein